MKVSAAKGNEAEWRRQERGEPLSSSLFPFSWALWGGVCVWGCQATREFPGIGLLSLPSCPRVVGISPDQCLFSVWLVPGDSSIAQEETPGTTGRGDRKA